MKGRASERASARLARPIALPAKEMRLAQLSREGAQRPRRRYASLNSPPVLREAGDARQRPGLLWGEPDWEEGVLARKPVVVACS